MDQKLRTSSAECSNDTLWLLHITDNHLFADRSEGRHGVNSADSLRRVLSSATATRQPDLVVETGDIAHDSITEVYTYFKALLREYVDCPMIATPGNHDLSEPFYEVLSCSTRQKKSWRIVAIDTHQDEKVSGYLAPAELVRLNKELTTESMPTLVIGHHPATEIGSAWIDEHKVENNDELLSLLTDHSHVKAYLCGHVHQAYEASVHGLKLLTTPSTCWQFKPQCAQFTVDELGAGWRWLALRGDGRIDTYVERLGAGT